MGRKSSGMKVVVTAVEQILVTFIKNHDSKHVSNQKWSRNGLPGMPTSEML